MKRLQSHVQNLKSTLPWTKAPLIVGAPMRLLSGPKLAVAVSAAGGIGFIGPGADPEHLEATLAQAKAEVSRNSFLKDSAGKGKVLPIGIGIQTWAGDLNIMTKILQKSEEDAKPAVIWLFAPRYGQTELDEWTKTVRDGSPGTQVWIQVASVKDAVAAASSEERPDVLVVQGTDAGGHSLTQGAGIITLLPEVADTLAELGPEAASIPLIAAGGIADARGASAAFMLGASGVAMGTRFLASKEAVINPGYQGHILAAVDGGQNTVRTQLYNHLRGTTDWPESYDARGIVNQSWRDHKAGVTFDENKILHDEMLKKGAEGWGEKGRIATYAGTGIGLIKEVKGASNIVYEVRTGISDAINQALESVS